MSTLLVVFSAPISFALSGDFYEFNSCEGAVKPKSSCSVSVQFIPTKTGARKARAGVATGNTASAPKPVSLTGTGN